MAREIQKAFADCRGDNYSLLVSPVIVMGGKTNHFPCRLQSPPDHADTGTRRNLCPSNKVNMMKKLATTFFAFALISIGISRGSLTHAQSAVLLDMYGQGVHAYYSGQHQEAHDLFSAAINNGLQDPRAYYFRGIVSDIQGSQYEAESDWRQGAQLEARGKIIGSIGRALVRFQGNRRLELEKIRAKEKLQYLAEATIRSQHPGVTNSMAPRPAAPTVTPGASIAIPPSIPSAIDDNPFDDDSTADPTVENDDALKDAMNDPLADQPTDAPSGDAPEDAGDDPFAGDDSAAGDDPFGGDDDDPFASGDDDDPFAN